MTNAANFAAGFAAQLDAVAGLTTVSTDPTLSASVGALKAQVVAFGEKTDTVSAGRAEAAQHPDNPFASNPFSYFVLAGEGDAVAAASAELAAQLRAKSAPAKKKVGPKAWALFGESLFNTVAPLAQGLKEGGAANFDLQSTLQAGTSLIGEGGPLAGIINPELINEAMGVVMGSMFSGEPLDETIAKFIAGKIIDTGAGYATGALDRAFEKSALKAELEALDDIATTIETSGRTLDRLAKVSTKAASIEGSARHVKNHLAEFASDKGKAKLAEGILAVMQMTGLSGKISVLVGGQQTEGDSAEGGEGGDAGELGLGGVDINELLKAMGGSESGGPAQPGPENPCLFGQPTADGQPTGQAPTGTDGDDAPNGGEGDGAPNGGEGGDAPGANGDDAPAGTEGKPARRRAPRKPRGTQGE